MYTQAFTSSRSMNQPSSVCPIATELPVASLLLLMWTRHKNPLQIITSRSGGVRNIVMSVSVSVCLSAGISRKPRGRTSPYFLRMLSVAVARSSSGGVTVSYVFLVLWMTLCFHIMGPIRAVTSYNLCS